MGNILLGGNWRKCSHLYVTSKSVEARLEHQLWAEHRAKQIVSPFESQDKNLNLAAPICLTAEQSIAPKEERSELGDSFDLHREEVTETSQHSTKPDWKSGETSLSISSHSL